MAKAITHYSPHDVHGGDVLAANAAGIIQGVFVAIGATGLIAADFRQSAGPLVAVGVAIQDAVLTDPRGNTIKTEDFLSFVTQGRVGGFSGLTPGATYYLLSGGSVQLTDPSGSTNDIRQKVGFALDDTTLVIQIGAEVKHA